jgi:isoprenylcysteine carboxyl methyltransferase (ICMT) family protein YpbQ
MSFPGVLVSANLLFLIYYFLSVLLIMVRIPKEERMMLESLVKSIAFT